MKPEAIIFFGVFDFALPEYQKWVRGLSKYADYTKIYISDLASLSDGIKNYFDKVIKVDDAVDYDTLARVIRQLQTDFSLRQVFFYREDGVYLCGKLRSEFGIRGFAGIPGKVGA
jgi:hypothetical protein